ncbi:MAG: ThiF family adenylyltransferase [Actinomycetota bacterium]|nr:ThiF family adenylyltransferase [Actinomycetota bacterium]
MSLPRFLDRVVDAAAPALGGLERDAVRSKLEGTSVTLVAGERANDGAGRAGGLLTANLLARLYPRIQLEGPQEFVEAAKSEIVLVNPRADIGPREDKSAAALGYETSTVEKASVSVCARGWNAYVDSSVDESEPAAGPAALAAAALGVAELFRLVFAAQLGDRARKREQRGAFNLITLGPPSFGLAVPDAIDAGTFRLVGAGAIGQAAARTLADSGARGTLLAVDHEKVALSNLQRYVLTRDTDIGAVKVDLLRERLGTSSVEVVPIAAEWHAGLADEQLPTLVALDSAEARIGVQASLPGPIYNAWTQPADVGWSRHERFGEDPCLACLYWPERQAPSRHEQIAAAFGQHPLRVLGYLVQGLPVGLPLPHGGIPVVPGFDLPADADQWLVTPIVDDIAAAAGVDNGTLAAWRELPLADVYQDGICGGALLHLGVGEAPREVLVPLAHQSVLAGVMLATQYLVAQVPELARARAAAVEGRYDVLAGLPQVIGRPRTRTDQCLCGDAVFRSVYGEKLGQGAGTGAPQVS